MSSLKNCKIGSDIRSVPFFVSREKPWSSIFSGFPLMTLVHCYRRLSSSDLERHGTDPQSPRIISSIPRHARITMTSERRSATGLIQVMVKAGRPARRRMSSSWP